MMVQTEIGLLPEDWEVVRIEDQFKTFSTASFSRDQMSDQGEVMCVHYGDIHTKYGNIVDANKDEIPFVSAMQAARYKLLKDGDILLADASEDDEGIGKPIAIICYNKKIIAGLHILPLRPKNNECWDVRFPSYLFSGRMVKGQVEKLSEGTKVNSITYNKIKDVVVPLPKDKTEQQNIASALSSIDKLIDDLGRTIQKKQRIREGAMEELLSGKKRLPGFTEEWVESKLNQYGKMIRGVSYKPEQAFYIKAIDSTPLLRSNNVQNGKMVYDDVVFVLDVCINKQQYMQQGDILICTANGSRALVGKSALFNHTNVYTFGAFMGVLRCNDVRFSPYIFYLLQTKRYKHKIDDVLAGSAINNLNSSEIEEITFMTPSNEKEAFAIADILTSMDDEISLLESERAKYEQIRSGMMEELLTGKKRLIKKIKWTKTLQVPQS